MRQVEGGLSGLLFLVLTLWAVCPQLLSLCEVEGFPVPHPVRPFISTGYGLGTPWALSRVTTLKPPETSVCM